MTVVRTAFLLLLLLGAALHAAAPETEIARLRRENRELRGKLLQTEERLNAYRLWLGNVTLDQEAMAVGERERRALLVLEELARRGNSLSMAALAVRDECRKLIAEMPVGPARKAQMELRLDELTRAAGEFAALTIPGDSHAGSARILAIDRDLKVAVISAGAGAGVFPGMIFRAKERPQVRLRVVGTRFEGAVAELIAGNWQDVVPGMEVSALHQQRE